LQIASRSGIPTEMAAIRPRYAFRGVNPSAPPPAAKWDATTGGNDWPENRRKDTDPIRTRSRSGIADERILYPYRQRYAVIVVKFNRCV